MAEFFDLLIFPASLEAHILRRSFKAEYPIKEIGRI
jgi:hypothetical protein